MEQEKLFWNFRLSANWTRNIKSGKIQSNVTLRSNWDVFVFIWISRSWSSSFEIQKDGNFKIIFLVPYPIIYNPGCNEYLKYFFNYLFHDQNFLSLISGFPLMKKALHSQTMAKQIKKVLDWPNLTPFMKPCSPVLTVDWPGPLGPKFPSGGNQLPHRLVWPIDPKKKWHSLC